MEKPCGWSVETLTVFAAGSWNWKSFSVNTELIFAT
jgi:hypothetical protein